MSFCGFFEKTMSRHRLQAFHYAARGAAHERECDAAVTRVSPCVADLPRTL